MNIALIGMPGSGKSTVGKALAHELTWNFLDTDSLIELETGECISNYISTHGEDKFCEIQERVVSGLKTTCTAISTGGGVIYSVRCVRRLQNISEVIFLDVDLDLITKRIEKEPRNLIGGRNANIASMYFERHPLYLKYAAHKIEASTKNVDIIVQEIIALLGLRRN